MNPIKKKLMSPRYDWGATIFKMHDNTFGFKHDKLRVQLQKGVTFCDFMEHSSWKKPDNKYIYINYDRGPHLFLFEIAPGVYVPMKVMTDFGELDPKEVSKLRQTIQKAKAVCDPIDNELAKSYAKLEQLQEDPQKNTKEIYELNQHIDKLKHPEYKEMVKKGNQAYKKLKQIEAYFYIPKEEAKHWFGQKMDETHTKYPSMSSKLKDLALPIGLIIIAFVLLMVFKDKIAELFSGLMNLGG